MTARPPRGRTAHAAWATLAAVLAVLLIDVRPASAQEYRRRRQRDLSAESASPAPAYGSAARGLGRARRVPVVPVHRRALVKVRPRNDSGDVEAIEEIDTESSAASSDGPASWWGDAWPVWDQVLDSYTPRPVRKHTLNTFISHRSSDGVLRSPLFNAFGIDSFNNVLLGLRYGILERMDAGINRWGGAYYDTYEFDLRGHLLDQKTFHLDLALRAGFTWFAQPHAKDASGLFAQLILGRLIADRVFVGGGLIYHSSSSGPRKTNLSAKSSVALQLAVDWRVSGGLSLAFELTPALGGYKERYPNMTLGPKFVTNRHTFAIVLSNTQYFSTDSIITNSNKINPLDWKLGFHLSREL